MEMILLTSFFANGISFLWRKQHQNYFPVGLLLSSDVFFWRTWRARTRRCWTVTRKDKQDAKEMLLDLPRARIKTRANECGLKSAVCVSSGVSVTGFIFSIGMRYQRLSKLVTSLICLKRSTAWRREKWIPNLEKGTLILLANYREIKLIPKQVNRWIFIEK